MKRLRSQRAQSTAEYAVLFAIVIGAAIGVQQLVKGRLQSAVKLQADAYTTAAKITATDTGEDVNRKTHSKSGVNLDMKTSREGAVKIDSSSVTTQDKK